MYYTCTVYLIITHCWFHDPNPLSTSGSLHRPLPLRRWVCRGGRDRTSMEDRAGLDVHCLDDHAHILVTRISLPLLFFSFYFHWDVNGDV